MNEVKSTPKDFFLHLSAAVGLYLSAISLLQLLFEIINYAFPDQLNYYVDPYSSTVRWAIAMLLTVFPIYLVLLWTIERDVVKNAGKKDLGIRRWLSYMTLFVAGVTIVIDLVVLINSFLGGELSTRFGLKVLSVFVVAGMVFGYYLYDLRRQALTPTGGRKVFAIASIVIVVTSLVAGFIVMGSPTTARNMKFDDRRVSDLGTIQWQLVDHYQRTGVLPEKLDPLSDPLSGFNVPIDPQTNSAYVYEKTGKLTFRLCAEFSLPSNTDKRAMSYATGPLETGENWKHGAGKTCFDRTIDPSRYPVRSDFPKGVPAVPRAL